jgi:hypothetical protein
MNGVKMGLHHLSVNRVGGNNLPRFPQQAQPSLEESNMQLFQNNDDNQSLASARSQSEVDITALQVLAAHLLSFTYYCLTSNFNYTSCAPL